MPSEQPGHVVALNVLLAGIVISNTSVNFSPVFKPSVFVDPITLHKAQPCQQQKTSFTIYTPEKKKKKRGCPSQRNNYCTEIGATGGLPISVHPETMRPSRQLDITELMEFHPGPMMACVAILLLPNWSAGQVFVRRDKHHKEATEATHMTQTHCTGSTQQTHNNRHTTATLQWKTTSGYLKIEKINFIIVSIAWRLTASQQLASSFCFSRSLFCNKPDSWPKVEELQQRKNTKHNTSVHQVFGGKISKAAF